MDEEGPVMRAAESAGLRQGKPGQLLAAFRPVCQPPPLDRLLSNKC